MDLRRQKLRKENNMSSRSMKEEKHSGVKEGSSADIARDKMKLKVVSVDGNLGFIDNSHHAINRMRKTSRVVKVGKE